MNEVAIQPHVEKKKRKSRANPMTAVMRDLGAAITRLKSAEARLSKMGVPMHANVKNVQQTIVDTSVALREAWADKAAETARQDALKAYALPLEDEQAPPVVDMTA